MKVKTIMLALALMLCSSMAFAEDRCVEHYRENVGQTRTFSTGQLEMLAPSSFGCPSVGFVYTGIVSRHTFSFRSSQYRSSVNVFYPTSTTYFKYFVGSFAFMLHVDTLSPHYIAVTITAVEWEEP
jgi:hypothetical protein